MWETSQEGNLRGFGQCGFESHPVMTDVFLIEEAIEPSPGVQ